MQVSGRYAQELASRGFLTIAFDPAYYGESGGTPRDMNSIDSCVECYQAAVDYLSNLENVDSEKIGIIGICGWGGYALQTACIDTRIKATVCSTMYNMSRVACKGYFDEQDNEESRYNAEEETLMLSEEYKKRAQRELEFIDVKAVEKHEYEKLEAIIKNKDDEIKLLNDEIKDLKRERKKTRKRNGLFKLISKFISRNDEMER